MARKKQHTLKVGEIVIPLEEQSPVVIQLVKLNRQLQAEIESLRDEVNRLKGLPETPKRAPANAQPGSLNNPQKPSQSANGKKKKPRKRTTNDGKRPGSAKQAKTPKLQIHDIQELRIDDLPEGTRSRGFVDYHVQDILFQPYNTRYRRARYQLPDGTLRTAPLPSHVRGHFGPTLRSYVIQQHHHNMVTQPLLHEELNEIGVQISSGMIDRLLTERHDDFHAEKDSLLPAAREVSFYFHTDDTSARHCGRNGHTLHIGNQWFASFFTTDSKSRVNFLEILRQPYNDYVLGGDALFYLEYHGATKKLQQQMTRVMKAAGGCLVVEGKKQWQRRLSRWRLKPEARRLVTEAALFGSLLIHDLYIHQPLISDDAKQFKVIGLMLGLCWLHAERHVARLIPLNGREQKAYDKTRDAIWRYYQRLRAYKESPTARKKSRLERDFDRLFLRKTGYPELNAALAKIHAKRENLLLVLEHPELPLHNNPSENDIRQYVKKRKISAGTRSELGRRCRDTFLSLKTTCRKLGISFWRYLQDRFRGAGEIPPLADLIRSSATTT